LEDEGRIGTELTFEGSKPIERLAFALMPEMAQRGDGEPIKDSDDSARLPDGPAKGPRYSSLGFLENKLSEPNVGDQGKIKSETEKLRMPNVHLAPEQIRALTTFLMGSQESALPANYQYRPLDYRRDIQEGWWVVKKYNCMGCHQFIPGQQTALMGMKHYQEAQEQLPPKLLTEGARVNPQWLLRFFAALSRQPFPYIPDATTPLTAKETDMARGLFSSTAAPCLKCHATGDAAHDRTATAPNFLLAHDRLKPDWVERWIIDPQAISPGTAMPSGLFKRLNDHWVFAGPTPPAFEGYDKDHTRLLVDYIFQLTPEEQHRVAGAMGRSQTSRNRT